MTKPTGKKVGRPSNAEKAAQVSVEGIGEWADTHRGVNQTWLTGAFRMDSRTVKMRLANCPVLREDDKGRPIYDFVEAARHLAKPPPAALAAFLRGMKVTDLPTFLQDQYWSAQRKRQIYEENAGNLWRTEAVLEVLGETFNGLKSEIQLWVDNIDQKVALTPEQRTLLLQQVDELQDRLYGSLKDMPNQRQTYSQIDSGEVVNESSPEFRLVLDEADLLGMSITYGSVCSGIEAASVAWEPLGFRPAWFAENDKAASGVLAHHWPHVPNHGDMTTLAARIVAGEVEAPDILVGGTPCQAFSLAGRRLGLADPRGQLTLAFMDIADAIDANRDDPAVIVWENVPGVLSHKDNPFGCFLAGLAGEDEALRCPGPRWSNAGAVFGPQRAVAWRTLDAQFFGLAQRRRRVFVVASARAGFDPATVLLEFEGLRRDFAPRRETGEGLTHPIAPSLTSGGRDVARAGDPKGQDPVIACERGGSARVEAFGGNNQAGPIDVATARNAHAGPHGRLDFESETFVVQSVALRGRDEGATAELGGNLAHALRASGGGGDKPHVLAFDGGQVAVFVTGEITHALKADGFDGSEDGTGRGQPITVSHMAVRRLMPVECERLQGFPDGHTDIPVSGPKFNRKEVKRQADGPRYKQIGNSMAVNVMAWIGERVARELALSEPANDNLALLMAIIA